MKGDAVIILHGWGSSAHSFDRIKEALIKGSFRVYVPDLPGFGGAAEPPSDWRLNDYATFVLRFAEEQRIDKFYLLGHSFGGQVGILFAARFPERVKGLILYGAAAVRRKDSFKRQIFMVFAKTGKKFLSFPPFRFLQRPAARLLYKTAGSVDYHRASDTMKSVMRTILKEDVTSFLPRISAPTLLIWGEHDRATPLADAEIIRKSLPNATLAVIAGAGHSAHKEQPEKFLESLLPFLLK
ncbi:MAG: alpha/beta hydrolase [Candidatus Colwellbacteria bacterium]|nr:alpha/beta hydrolase [Candidatus Colwellbacteria bacterium]